MVDENRVRELYVEYNTVIKPLIAEVEARMEQFLCLYLMRFVLYMIIYPVVIRTI